jgi:YegS/Rv2252/BmrU family lipid kinase
MTQTTFDPNTEAPATPPADQKCVYVIFNPTSGKSDPEERKKTISEALSSHGYTCQFIATTKQQGAKACAEEALRQGADLLAVSGGDGTVMEAMSAVVGKDIPIAVFPAGTGNLLSVNLGIPMTVPDAVHVALAGRKYALDLARTGDGQYFAIMGGLGMDAQMIKDSDRKAKDKLGKLAYFVAALKNLPRRRARVEITLDDRPPLQRRVKSVLLANMGKITGGLEAMPTASPSDGLLDIGILKAATLADWARLLGNALLGRAQQDRSLEVYQARRVTLRPRRPQPVEFDGEDGGTTRELTVEIVPQAVQVLIPETAPAAHDSQDLPPAVVAERTAKRRLLIPLALLLLAVGITLTWRRRKP